jgi:hypothetical protein
MRGSAVISARRTSLRLTAKFLMELLEAEAAIGPIEIGCGLNPRGQILANFRIADYTDKWTPCICR